jgi:hypothetical protein
MSTAVLWAVSAEGEKRRTGASKQTNKPIDAPYSQWHPPLELTLLSSLNCPPTLFSDEPWCDKPPSIVVLEPRYTKESIVCQLIVDHMEHKQKSNLSEEISLLVTKHKIGGVLISILI